MSNFKNNLNVEDQLIVNKLKLNIDKTRCMLFHPVKTNFWKSITFDVMIGKTIIKNVNSYKYLGVIIDSNINWSEVYLIRTCRNFKN